MIQFKRVPVGKTFKCGDTRYRKVSIDGCFKLKPSGRGETHARVKLSRSALCEVLS